MSTHAAHDALGALALRREDWTRPEEVPAAGSLEAEETARRRLDEHASLLPIADGRATARYMARIFSGGTSGIMLCS